MNVLIGDIGNTITKICLIENKNFKVKKVAYFESEKILNIQIEEKFTTERGRINCSLNDTVGWRWFGLQFVISDY